MPYNSGTTRARHDRSKHLHPRQISISRDFNGPFGNPHVVPQLTNKVEKQKAVLVAVAKHRYDLHRNVDLMDKARANITGKEMLCWCNADDPCHGDNYLAICDLTAAEYAEFRSYAIECISNGQEIEF